MNDKNDDADYSVRLDKWLWFARFYKTRALALEAIKAGKIKQAGNRVKPSRTVRPGEEYTLRIDPYLWTVTVRATGQRRGPAAEAALLYEESAQSRQDRAALTAQIKLNNQLVTRTPGRPTKRDRRQIVKFTRSE